MTVTRVDKDPTTLSMTLVAEFDAAAERVWQVWSDPRQLERWWGPPTYPATVEEHDLSPGGRVTYFMTGPDGDKPRGYWQITAVEPPRRLEFVDGFADDSGAPVDSMPESTVEVRLHDRTEGGTRMEVRTVFGSAEAMEQLLAMGMVEGMTEAANQIDALLAS